MSKTIITLTGPTCSGKTTLQKMLQNKGLSGIVSFTTRKMRAGEIEGKDYYFLSNDIVEVLTAEDLVESIKLNGNSYGILTTEINRVLGTGKDIVVVVEPNGVRQVGIFCDKNKLNHISVFIDNSDFTIYRRFLERFYADGQASIDTYASRLCNLTVEMKDWRVAYPYKMVFSSFNSINDEYIVNQILNELKDNDKS